MPTVRSDGLELFYVDLPPSEGPQGAPVLLIHGFASTHAVNWVNTLWTKTLTDAGYRVIALDNRGHGASDKPHDPAAYHTTIMADDALTLMDQLEIGQAHVMGYSMGARITAFLAQAAPQRVRTATLGGLGAHLVDSVGLPQSVADALDAPTLADVTDPMGRLFRRFAEANRGDLKALAACIRGSRQSLDVAAAGQIRCPVLVAVGTKDPIAGDPHTLAALFPEGRAFDIPDRDHNLAVGDRLFKAEVLAFLGEAADEKQRPS